MARNIAVFFDGTWNKAADKDDEKATETNVRKLYEATPDMPSGPEAQESWYDAWVGRTGTTAFAAEPSATGSTTTFDRATASSPRTTTMAIRSTSSVSRAVRTRRAAWSDSFASAASSTTRTRSSRPSASSESGGRSGRTEGDPVSRAVRARREDQVHRSLEHGWRAGIPMHALSWLNEAEYDLSRHAALEDRRERLSRGGEDQWREGLRRARGTRSPSPARRSRSTGSPARTETWAEVTRRTTRSDGSRTERCIGSRALRRTADSMFGAALLLEDANECVGTLHALCSPTSSTASTG